jgi:uncharacterized integral membrane protein (TIGR00698 family)
LAKIPPSQYSGWLEYIKAILPGFLLCLALGVLAKWIDRFLIPDWLIFFNYVLLAIILGLAVKNLIPLPAHFFAGIEFSTKICLYIGIVLLGAKLNLFEIFAVGGKALIMVALSITLCLFLGGWLGKRLFGNERWGHLIGAGLGVCGVSAIIALAPVIKAREKEVVLALGIALLADILVLLALPAIAIPLNWGDNLTGFMAGVVPANTAQCIAIGYSYSEAAGIVTTIVKSARNSFLPIVIIVLTYIYTKKGLPVGEKVCLQLLWHKFPKFIFGLLIAAALSTFGFFTPEAINIAGDLSSWFFVLCFVGIGAGIDFRLFRRQDLGIISFGLFITILLGLYVYLYSTIFLAYY